MKNFFLTTLAIISVFGATTYAEESTELTSKIQAKELEVRAIEAQKNTETICTAAIKQTESYSDSVNYQLAGFDNIALGSEEYLINGFKKAQEYYQAALNNFSIAQALCKESHHLQLSKKGYDSALTDNIAMRIGNGLKNSNETKLAEIFSGELILIINRIIAALAILYIVFIGVKYILAMGDEEKMSNYKTQAAWLILGLAIVSVAEFVGFELLDPSGGNDILSGETQANFMDKVRDVVRYFEYAAGAFMLVNAILAGYHLIMSGDKEETISQEKSFLKSLLLGSGFILMSEVIVRVLSFRDSPTRTTEILVSEVAGIINFTLSFVAILAMTMLVLASLYYVISFGDEDQTTRAKRMIKTSIIGVIISSASYVLVRFLIS